jgi:AcrR family transcriptional regulator
VELVAGKAVKSGRKAKGAGYLRRAEILQAAEKLFVREGYQGATIRKIAQEVGLSSTALYMHFRDKSQMLLEICEATFAHLRDSNREIAALPIAPEQRVRRMLESYIQFALANPNAYLVAFELSASTPLRCSPEEATHVGWATCHGLVGLMVNHPEVEWPAAREEMIRITLDTLIAGLKAG